MYEKFLGDIVEVGLDYHCLRGTLHAVHNHYIELYIVDDVADTFEECIINIKKVNYISRDVRKAKAKRSKKANTK